MNRTSRITATLAASALIAGLGTASAFAATSAPAPAALPVTLSASTDGASAAWSPDGNIVLTPGTDASTTFAQVAVSIKALDSRKAPATPPSFTTDNYAAGSPRWVIELANGSFIDGYPSQLGGGATDDFTGAQWAVGNSGTYVTYQAALSGANDALGNVKVTDAFIVADGDQASGTADTLTGVQYDGETPVAPVAPPVAPVLSKGHVVSVTGTRAVVAWSQTVSSVDDLTITGPGAINGHTGTTKNDEAVYSGLEPGHAYTVHIQPVLNGKPFGAAGYVDLVTTK